MPLISCFSSIHISGKFHKHYASTSIFQCCVPLHILPCAITISFNSHIIILMVHGKPKHLYKRVYLPTSLKNRSRLYLWLQLMGILKDISHRRRNAWKVLLQSKICYQLCSILGSELWWKGKKNSVIQRDWSTKLLIPLKKQTVFLQRILKLSLLQ